MKTSGMTRLALLFWSFSCYGFDKFDAAVCDANTNNPARVIAIETLEFTLSAKVMMILPN